MRHVIKFDKVPDSSIILKNFGKVNYCDSYQIIKNTNDTIDNITTEIFKTPIWVDYLIKIRNSIAGLFGLKTENKKDTNVANHYSIGSKAVYFTVIDRNDYEIVMAENDKHLNFRTSVLINRNGIDSKIYLTTIVRYNNIWGRLYFMPVKPFHSIIMKSILKRALI